MKNLRPALALVALLGVVAGCSGSGAPSITDPNEVISKSVAAAPAVKSVHVKVAVTGKINAGALGGLSSAASALSGNLTLDGTSAEGDVDVANQAADIKITLPSLFGTGEVIVSGGNLYYKLSLTGAKFTKMPLSNSPVSIPSPGTVASANPSALASSLGKSLADAGVTATLLADGNVGGTAAYHVSLSVPVAKINSLLAAAGGSATAGLALDSASVDYWVYKDSLLPAQLEVKASAGTFGNLDITATLTNYNQAVTINAPAASDVSK